MLIVLLWTFVSVAETTVYTCPKMINFKTSSIKPTGGSNAGFSNFSFRAYLTPGADAFDKYFGYCYYEAYHSTKYQTNNWAPFYTYTAKSGVSCSTGNGNNRGNITCSDGTKLNCPTGLNLVPALPNAGDLQKAWTYNGMLKDANCFEVNGKTRCNCNYYAMEIAYKTKSDKDQVCTASDNIITCVK